MGVRGLKTFIENNPDLIICDYELKNTHLIIDGNNIKTAIFHKSHENDRADLFGSDITRFSKLIRVFLDNLVKANIVPIFVFDGAKDTSLYDKTSEQLRRSLQRFDQIKIIYEKGFGDIIMPMNTSTVFSSILLDYGFKIVGCMFEADNEIARLSNRFKGPILSNDSDFFLMDLEHGVISFDTGEFLNQTNDTKTILNQTKTAIPIKCRLFTQDRFVQMFPNLDKLCLPLLGVLAGNDFVTEEKFEQLLNQLPSHVIRDNAGLTGKQFKQRLAFSHQRILKVLYFLCDKKPNEAVNQICSKFANEKRKTVKEFINKYQKFYDIPAENEFSEELKKICLKGSRKTFKSNQSKFEIEVKQLAEYLITCLEKHAMSFRILEMMHRNIMFLYPGIEDFTQPKSSRGCLMRTFSVLLRLVRTHHNEVRPLVFYDRVGRKYEKNVIKEICELEDFGTIDYIVYDLLSMSDESRLKLLLATFHCSLEEFDIGVSAYCQWFDFSNAQQALYVKLILDYIDLEEPGNRLSKRFKRAVYTAFIFYIYQTDETYRQMCEPDTLQESIYNINRYQLTRPLRATKYDMRIMHQLSQFAAVIHGFTMFNSLLGEPIPRMRIDNWLNSCLIYNLTNKIEKSTKALHGHEKAKIAFE